MQVYRYNARTDELMKLTDEANWGSHRTSNRLTDVKIADQRAARRVRHPRQSSPSTPKRP
jgi:hypothetical protein